VWTLIWKTPSDGSRDVAVKVVYSTSKVPFIIGQLQFNTSSLHGMHVEFLLWNVRKFYRKEAEIFPWNNVFFIAVDDKKKLRRFVRVGNARILTGMEFQEDPSNWSRYTAVNILCSTNKVPVVTEWSQKMVLLVNNAHTLVGVKCLENSSNRNLILPLGYFSSK